MKFESPDGFRHANLYYLCWACSCCTGGPAGVAVHKADSKAAQLRSMDPITAFATLAATRDGPIAPRAPELPGMWLPSIGTQLIIIMFLLEDKFQ